MNRNKQKGTTFERSIADYLHDKWSPFIDRMPLHGNSDKGDIANFLIGQRHATVIECKNERQYKLAEWVKEAQQEAINAGCLAGIVVAKRKGKADPSEQYVILTLEEFLRCLRAARSEFTMEHPV